MQNPSKFAQKFSRERWFPLGIGLGVVLAIGLLANSVSNYIFVSQRIQVDQLRRDLAEQVAQLDADLQRTTSQTQLAVVLTRAQARAGGRLAWIELRDTSDALLGRTGLDVPHSFSAAEVRAKMRARRSEEHTSELQSQ